MTNAAVPSGADDTATETSSRRGQRARVVVGFLVIVVVVAAALIAIYRTRRGFTGALGRIGAVGMLGSFAFGTLGIALNFPVWRTVLRGLGVDLRWKIGARVFFTSQLGKYVPGSIWPIVIQMEVGRSQGASRRTMLAANLITLVLSCAVGLSLACALLPFSDSHALSRYWWLLTVLPILFALLHPRAATALLGPALRRLGRELVTHNLPVGSSARAACWSLASFLTLGAHVAIVALMVGGGGPSTALLCVAGMALAIPAGILFIPAPAGAGIRDVILALVLNASLNPGQTILVVVASRVILISGDLTLAAAGLVLSRGRARDSLVTKDRPEERSE